jgi:hypothetical protein
MKKKILLGLATIGFALVLTSCEKLPQPEIDAANAAIEQAKAAQAETYVPEEYTALQDSLRVAMENVEAQKSKLFKHYKKAKAQLIQVATISATVKTDAEAKKEQVKQEVAQLLTEVNALITEDKQLLAKAPRGKEGKAALEAIKNDIATIEGSITEVTNLQTSGDFMAADLKIKAAKEKATEINTELKDAIAKVKGKGKGKK